MDACIASGGGKSQAPRLLFLLCVALALCPGSAPAQRDNPNRPGTQVEATHYQIEVSFQSDKSFLRARAGVSLRAPRPTVASRTPAIQGVDTIEFELNAHLGILEVSDTGGRKLDFARSQRLGSPKLVVNLPEPLLAGQNTTLTFTYEGVLPPKPLDYITRDGILLRDESRWYPAVDISAFTHDEIAVTLPRGWRAITSGEPMDLPSTLPAEIRRWKTARPVSSRSLVAYPASAWGACASVETREGALPGTPRRVEVCVPQEGQRAALAMAGKTSALLQRYGAALGPYAGQGFYVVQGFPRQRGAIGYSAPGFLVVSEDFAKFHDYPGYAPEFLPHEIAHQWFPIEVTLERAEDGWLAESLAEYLAWRYLAEKEPEQARLFVARAMRDALTPEPLRPLSLGLKLFALEDLDIVHRTLYQRGMLVWRTLETVAGRERVDRALREYYRRYAGRAGSIPDFRKVCEEIAQRDLGWFFEYFLDGTRIPEIELRRTPSSTPIEVAGEIVVRNVPADFSVRVAMRLETSAGPLDHSVATRGEVTPFTVPSDRPITRIALDPNVRILRWTEAARRNRAQRALLAEVAGLERAGQLERAAEACQGALALDPENLAANAQSIHFVLGRLRYRQGRLHAAFAAFQRVLELESLDPIGSDFNRAWSRIYRARIERRRGRPAAARTEAQAGLALRSPALYTPVAWTSLPGQPTTAAQELERLSR